MRQSRTPRSVWPWQPGLAAWPHRRIEDRRETRPFRHVPDIRISAISVNYIIPFSILMPTGCEESLNDAVPLKT